MCFASAPKPVTPAPPPPPPPVLEQAAPNTSAAVVNDQLKGNAQGTKKYRTSGLGIPGDATGSGGSNLGIVG